MGARRAPRVLPVGAPSVWASSVSISWRWCPPVSRRRLWRASVAVCGVRFVGAPFRRPCRQRWLPGFAASSPPRSLRAPAGSARRRRGCSLTFHRAAGEIATAPARRRDKPANSPARLSVATRPAPLTRRARPAWLHRARRCSHAADAATPPIIVAIVAIVAIVLVRFARVNTPNDNANYSI